MNTAEQVKQDERFDKNGFPTQETLDKLSARVNGVMRDQGIIANDRVLMALVREVQAHRELAAKLVAVLKAKGVAL
jgi:hypothetical protein